MEEVGTGLLDRLDSMQRVAASASGGPLLVVAGPGTGKTRTLTHRIAYLCAELARAARRIASRSRSPGGRRRRCAPAWRRCSARMPTGSPWPRSTPSGCGSCRERGSASGLSRVSQVADENQRAAALADGDGDHERVHETAAGAEPGRPGRADHPLRRAAAGRSRAGRPLPRRGGAGSSSTSTRTSTRRSTNCCACSCRPTATSARSATRTRRSTHSAARTSATSSASRQDFIDARMVRLARNYRSSAPIIAAASQAIAPTSLVRGRRLEPARLEPDAPLVGVHAAANVEHRGRVGRADDRRARRWRVAPLVRRRKGRLASRLHRWTVLFGHRRALSYGCSGQRRSWRP